MMIKVVGYPHPFLSSHNEFELEPGITYREIVAKVQPDEALRNAIVVCEDEPIPEDRWDEEASDGKTVIVKIVPQGTGDTGGDIAKGGSIGFIAGFVIFATLGWTGIGAAVGIGLMGLGAVAMATGGIVSMVERFSPSLTDKSSETNPSIAGASNTYGAWRPVPVILGKHLVTPYYGASPYTELGGTDGVDQYLHLLFVVGRGPLKVSQLKIGDNLLASNAADVRNGSISVADGNYSDVSVQIYQDGSQASLYPKLIVEEQIGVQLSSADAAAAHIYTTPKKTTRIEADIVFPSGLLKYDDKGNKGDASVVVTAYFRAKGAASWSTLGTISQSKAKAETIRYNVGLDVTAGEYEVRLARTTADSTDSNTIDKVSWLCLRSFRDQYPIDSSVLDDVVMIAMKIKATDQLSGVVDKFNLLAESLYQAYSGTGSGTAAWTAAASSNPAAAFLYLLRGGANPRPVPDALVDWPTLEEWHTYCAAKGFGCNAVVSSDITLRDMLARIALSGRASLTLRDGLYSVVVDKERTTPVQFFTPRNSRDFIGQKEFPEVIHGYRISFINSENDYSSDEIIVLDDNYLFDIDSDGTLEDAFGTEYASVPSGYALATLFEEISLWGVVTPSQVWKHGRYLLACRRLRPETFQITTGIANLRCQRGDLVRVAHDVPLLGLAYGRIKSLVTDGGGNVTGIVTDEECPMEVGKTYEVRLQNDAGTLIERTITEVVTAGNYTSLSFTAFIPAADALSPDSMFAFGESGLETVPMIIAGYEGLEDLEANLTLVEYNVAIYSADIGTIPAYESRTTRAKQFSPSKTVEESGNQTPQLPTAADAATYNYANNIAPTNNVTELAFSSEANADGSVDIPFSFKYVHGAVPAAGFLIYAKSGPQDPVEILSIDQAAKFIPASSDSGEQPYSSSLQALSVRYGGAGAIARVYHLAVVAVSQCAGGYIPCASGLVEVDGWTAKTFVATITDVAIKSYQGQGVNRRAIKIDAESLDWLDAPDTSPATDELLRARIGRLGVGSTILMDGDFRSNITSVWSNESVIDSNPSNSPSSIQLTDGTRRMIYIRESDGFLVEKIYNGSSWGSVSVINAASSAVPRAILLHDGTIRVAYSRNTDHYIVERIYSGSSWGAEQIVTPIPSFYPTYIQTTDGVLRICYIHNSNGYLYEKLYSGSSWGSESLINSAATTTPTYGQDLSGNIHIAYSRDSDIYLVERINSGLSWGGEQVINAGLSQNPSFAITLTGELHIAYRKLYSGDLVERIYSVSSWGSEISICSPGGEGPSYVQLYDGDFRIAYRQSTTSALVERSLQAYSQVGTGIIERGSNPNGSYIKFGDGTLICRGFFPSVVINSGSGIYYTSFFVPFAHAFYDSTWDASPSITNWTDIAWVALVGVPSNSAMNLHVASNVKNVTVSGVYTVIGRWRA